MNNFRELKVWKKSIDLNKDIYSITSNFPKHEQFGITSQIRRASISISNNIAEGCGRYSNQEFKRFLNIAFSSAYEVENMIIICFELNMLSISQNDKLITQIQEIEKMLVGLIKKI